MTAATRIRFLSATAISGLISLSAVQPAFAQTAGQISDAPTASPQEDIIVTGSRIPRRDLQGISPIAVTTGEQIKLARAVTVEDFSVKIPQLAGGVNSTSTGSDAYGAQTLDLRIIHTTSGAAPSWPRAAMYAARPVSARPMPRPRSSSTTPIPDR